MLGRGSLADYFDGVAVKRLSAVETSPQISNQHEFNGSRALRELLGDEDRRRIEARFVWLGEEQEGVSEDGWLSWYDSRRRQTHRAAEYRLYYQRNAVSELMHAGDTLFIARRPDGSLLIVVAPADSTIQNQLLWLFGIEDQPELDFTLREIERDSAAGLDFASRYILDELGIDAEEPEADLLDELLVPFGTKFPTTKEFSALARASLPDISARDQPDQVLMAWIEREELLFRRLERSIISDRIKTGFASGQEVDVEGFLAFSLSVQNRRKSRAGQSLELHLEELFSSRGIRFSRGAETENRNRPDFLFPGQVEYRDLSFPAGRLTMLASKSSLKDRWRQVLPEAQRIVRKHLLTLEPGISENQTSQMQAEALQLVVPLQLQTTYRPSQQSWLISVADFIGLVEERQV